MLNGGSSPFVLDYTGYHFHFVKKNQHIFEISFGIWPTVNFPFITATVNLSSPDNVKVNELIIHTWALIGSHFWKIACKRLPLSNSKQTQVAIGTYSGNYITQKCPYIRNTIPFCNSLLNSRHIPLQNPMVAMRMWSPMFFSDILPRVGQ